MIFEPKFPYKGNQLILSSDRVILHSKSDAIFLFGKQAVSLSSTKTINLDAFDKVLIDCKIIELGSKAQTLGEPLILGKTFAIQMAVFLDRIAAAGTLLANVSETNLGASMQYIAMAGQKINDEATRLGDLVRNPDSIILSKNTFTR
jgi:hypothetical protein